MAAPAPAPEPAPAPAERTPSERPSPLADRRQFLQSTGAAALAGPLAACAVHASDKAGAKPPVVGDGEHRYECLHGWGELPARLRFGETHGVAVDSAGLVYVKHRLKTPDPIDAIVVFDDEGRFVRSFGQEFHGGGHGIDVRREGGQEFLYLCDVTHNVVAKTDLKGERVWLKGRLEEVDVYRDPAAKYSPTNVAFAPDGGFYIADGYGSHYIHQFDRDAKWVRSWGGEGDQPGKMRTPHGIWYDDRPGREPALAVADRANGRLQYFSLDGRHLGFVRDVSFPAHFDLRGELMVVPDLHARVTLFDKDNRALQHLGYDPDWTKEVLADNFKMRSRPELWRPGRFVHPHDACFDRNGDLFVVEWVLGGRVTRLRRSV